MIFKIINDYDNDTYYDTNYHTHDCVSGYYMSMLMSTNNVQLTTNNVTL